MFGLVPARSRAQTGRVSGTVYDSLNRRPLASATVQLVQPPPGHGSYSAQTDSLGHFQLFGVRAGQYITGILHPLLDTLGVLAPYGSVTVADGTEEHVALAIPSAARLTSAICAPAKESPIARKRDSTGAVVGHVYDAITGAPVASALIAVVWQVLGIEAHGVHRETRQLHVKTSDEGWFALCNLDAGDYQLRAANGVRNTGYVDLSLQGRELARVSLVLGVDSAGATLSGKVTTKEGRPLEGAQVVVDGSHTTAFTDERGVFSLSGLPTGTRMVEARALGYEPARGAVTPSVNEPTSVTIVMEKRVETLQAVTVLGRQSRRMRDLSGFVERSGRGFGHFITREKIDRTTSTSVCDLLREVPGVSVSSNGGIGCDASIRGMGSLSSCGLTVYVDNIKFDGTMREFTREYSPRDVAGMEVYSTATEPAQFPGGCGSLVVWLR
jgi:hypothetical protein